MADLIVLIELHLWRLGFIYNAKDGVVSNSVTYIV